MPVVPGRVHTTLLATVAGDLNPTQLEESASAKRN